MEGHGKSQEYFYINIIMKYRYYSDGRLYITGDYAKLKETLCL